MDTILGYVYDHGKGLTIMERENWRKQIGMDVSENKGKFGAVDQEGAEFGLVHGDCGDGGRMLFRMISVDGTINVDSIEDKLRVFGVVWVGVCKEEELLGGRNVGLLE